MKQMTLTLAVLIACGNAFCQAPKEKWLATDPFLSNGYFIVDRQKANARGVATFAVTISAVQQDANGLITSRLLDDFTITNGHYGRLDPHDLTSLTPNEQIDYLVTAFDANGDVVGGPQGIDDNNNFWPEICSLTCESYSTAWTLVARGNGTQAVLMLENATEDGSYFYFYVRDWYQWSQGNSLADFGLYDNLDYYLSTGSTEVIRIPEANGVFFDMSGFQFNEYGTQTIYGIRKGIGDYAPLAWNSSNEMSASGVHCDNLPAIYSNNSHISVLLDQYELIPLACHGIPGGATGVDQGDGPDGSLNDCWSLSVFGDCEGSLPCWAAQAMDCYQGASGPSGPETEGEGIGGIYVHHLLPDASPVGVVSVVVPPGKDPKLIPIPKTELEPGLYEFMIVKQNGRIVRHYEAVEQTQVISADFASFVNMNIYPVPVKDRDFAIDMDLMVPLNCTLTVINNMGLNYHTENLNFPIAGRNKHVVEMSAQWPNGIYHATVQFADGSSSSRSFNIEIGE